VCNDPVFGGGVRLVGVWRWLYSFTLRYMEDLRGVAGLEEEEQEQEKEQERTTLILFQIQETLQGMGARLDDGPAPLLSCPGVVGHLTLASYPSVCLYLGALTNHLPPGPSRDAGERRFLVGSYSEIAEAWRAEMWAERNISKTRLPMFILLLLLMC